MRKVKHKTSEFDHDWDDLTLFEKLPVRKTAGKSNRVEKARERKAQRLAKQTNQARFCA